MDEKTIKVVWICHFSNAEIHDRLNLGEGFFKGIIRRIVHKPLNCEVHDFAIWITNGIHEFEKIHGVELHIIFTKKTAASIFWRSLFYYSISLW